MKKAYRLLTGREKKFFPGIFILCLLVSQSFAQPSALIHWQRSLGGSAREDARAAIQSVDGGYVLAGIANSMDGDVTGLHDTMSLAGDIWAVKLDSAGVMQWQKCLGSSVTEEANTVQQTYDLGYIIAGLTGGNNDGDVWGNNGNGNGARDGWLVKLDAGGNLQWQKCLGGLWDEWTAGGQQTNDSGFVIGGVTFSNSGAYSSNHGSADFWISKTDAAGNEQWHKCLGGTSVDWGYSIIQTSDLGYIMCGSEGSNDGDVSGSHGNGDAWIVKLDAAGIIQWQRCYGGSDGDVAWKIKQTSNGGYIVLAGTSSLDGDVVGSMYSSPDWGTWATWIMKLDASGNIQWQRTIDPQVLNPKDIIETASGNFLIGGYASFTGAPMMMLDATGNTQWMTCCQGSGGNDIRSLIETNDGNFVAVGNAWGNTGDLTGWHGSGDFWIMKMTQPNWINGTVYNDLNQNCVKNGGEPGEILRWLNINPPPLSVQTDGTGFYSAVVDTGNYTITLNPAVAYNVNCPVSGSYSVSFSTPGTGSVNNNFADTVAAYCPELTISIGTWALRPCFHNTYTVTYCNSGTLNSYNDSIVIVFPPSVIPLSSTVPWTVVAPNTYSFIIDTLLIGQCGTFYITDSVSCTQPIGDTLCISASITTLAECYTGDNTDVDCRVTTNSCDPNSKEVSITNSSVTSWVSSGDIFNTDTLEYQINFQNTGTDTAFSVQIYDTLSSNLDISSFVSRGSSHSSSLTIHTYSPGVIVWVFDNILLPDSNTDEPGSHGFVKFSIRLRSGTPPGTQVFNSAAIVFDYNNPVITNTTVSTIIDTATGIDELQKPVAVIYPNPATNFIAFDSSVQLQSSKMLITDAYGKIVNARKISSNAFDISKLAQGIYFIKIIAHDGSTRVCKFIKQ